MSASLPRSLTSSLLTSSLLASSLRRWRRSVGGLLAPHQGALANARRAVERDRRAAAERQQLGLSLPG